MAPSPQEFSNCGSPDLSGDRVVISGVSGLYPKAPTVKEFSEILYNKIDPITTENPRWDFKHPELANHIGMVPALDRFDSQFFKLSQRNGNTIDIMSKKLLEHVYQAIYDAGLSPEHLCGRNIGVYVGSCFSETEKACFNSEIKVGSALVGCSKAMFANRISYWLDIKGPSYSLDQSCCSSIAVLEAAYRAIERGECEAAIVGAGNLCMHPQTMIHYGRVITLSPDGKTKSFDKNADGCVVSEAVNVLFLQKAKDALRIYADVIHVKSSFSPIIEGENGPKYGFYRDSGLVASYLKEFYREANISPNSVEYVEAFGAGNPEIDKAELEAIEEVFCSNRTNPLIVGSVMSNIGYTESASGIASITKVLIGYRKGEIAGNLNCNNPRQDIPALTDNRMVIATEHLPIRRSYTAINNMSINGVNAHVLLHGHYKPKNLLLYKTALPRLVPISGRHENAVKKIIEDLKTRPIDPEEIALLHNIHEKRIAGHLARGFAILDTDTEEKTVCLSEMVEHFDDIKRPLWFVYSGMGSQWNKMGVELMRIPVFAAAIQRCHEALKPKGVDLMHILTTDDETVFNNILYAFIGIVSVQIGLTDVLKEIGIVPDKLIGHSLGEVGCAYADGGITLEQAILAAYARGRVSVDIPVIRGSMAAVGLGYQKIKSMCPSDIFVACHNGPDSCTLSGPEESMKKFIETLTSQGIFAKAVPTGNIAYHSKYIHNMSETHLKYLKEIIPSPALRSERWVSSSVPQKSWNEAIAKYSSADYHNNNMMNPVLFEEALRLVPSNAVLIEIAPHGLLQAILKRSLSSDCRNIPLTRRGHEDNAVHVLNAIGKLFMEGYNPEVARLYPKVEFPVSTETPALSHLVQWAHDEKWNLPLFVTGEKRMAAATKHLITLHDDEHKYLHGNIIRGRVVYPFAAALVATWDTLAMSIGVEKKKLSVHFRDVHLFAQPILHVQRQLRLNVILHRGTGKFEISDNSSKIATGYIIGNLTDITLPKVQFESTKPLDLNSEDVYELLEEKEYSYREVFRTIYKANSSLTEAQLLVNDNWTTLIDGILQLNALRQSHTTVCQPTYIRRICIDVEDHEQKIFTSDGKQVVAAYISDNHDMTRCGGIILDNIKFHKLPPSQTPILLKTLKFVPHFETRITDVETALQVYIQMVAENVNRDILNVVGVTRNKDFSMFNAFKDLINQSINNIIINYEEFQDNTLLNDKINLFKADLILIKDLTTDEQVFKKLHNSLHPEAFVLNFNTISDEKNKNDQPSPLYRVVSSINTGNNVLLEMLKVGSKDQNFVTVITISCQEDVSMLNSRLTDLPLNKGLLIIAITPVVPGLKEQINKWRKEIKDSKISMVTIDRNMVKEESLDQIPELAFSKLKDGYWGSEYLLPWEETSSKDHNVRLQSIRIGDLESLKWVEAPTPSGTGIIVDVHYAGLNDCDIKRATGVVPFKEGHDFVYGMDFSGKTEKSTTIALISNTIVVDVVVDIHPGFVCNARVMGVVSSGAVGSKVLANPELLWDVPDKWSLEDAATVPLAYSMAFYCLKIRTEITEGMTVFILGGAGALGQAAISIALSYNCKVFTTVSDNNKKQLLLKLFPQLDENNIGYSRNVLFGDEILRRTKGEGCDIVLSCATGELKNMALNCCAFSGITIDTVQIHSKEKFSFGLFHLTKQRSYATVDFSSIFTRNYVEDMKVLKELVNEGIQKGFVRPLTHVTYGPKDVVTAFKLMESPRRSGRVLIRLCDSKPEADSRFICSPDQWQLVFCDDVLGIQFTEKLISHGAKKIHLNCSVVPGHLKYKIKHWQKMGVEIRISSEDFVKTNVVESTIQTLSHIRPMESIFTILTNVANADTNVTKLDEVSRKLCPSLKHFLVSSTDHTFGNEIYSRRTLDELPITVIHLPQLKDATTKNTSTITRRAAIEAMAKVLASSSENVFVYPKISKPSLLKELACISGIEIPPKPSINSTLRDLGFPEIKSQTIKAYLRDVYNIYFEENVIPMLTVGQIHEIDNSSSWSGFEDLKGLQIFYSYIDPDEVLAGTSTVLMKSRAKYARDDEFEVDKPSLCVVPGLEGHHNRFNLVCDRLKIPVFSLQSGYQKPHETIQAMAQRYALTLKNKMKIKDNFYLLGYETGILLALETAKILEQDGQEGTIFCVGQTPEELKNTIEGFITSLNKNGVKLEDAVAKHMVNLLKEDDGAFSKIEVEVNKARNWKDKVDICVEELVGHKGHTSQFIRAVLNAALGRIEQFRAYQIEPFVLKSKIVMLHSASSFDPMTMQRYSKQPIAIHELDTPLGQIAQDLRCATIVNQHLSPDVLDLFEKNNTCETYLLNGKSFCFIQCPE